MPVAIVNQDEDETLDWSFDWAEEFLLAADNIVSPNIPAETIVSSIWIIPSGVNKISDNISDNITTVFINQVVKGSIYKIVNEITTDQGRTAQASLLIRGQDK
jgi:hypothetical protein